MQYEDVYLKGLFAKVKTIAIVGASNKNIRPSYFVQQYLIQKGFEVYPINPGLAGKEILGRKVYGSLQEVPVSIDMVDIFRNSDAAMGIVAESLALSPLPKVIWMQLSVINHDAAKLAEKQGVEVVMDRCPKIEYGRLSGEIGWMGVNRGIISSKKQVMRNKLNKA
jgi:predicted CoA-binding protein